MPQQFVPQPNRQTSLPQDDETEVLKRRREQIAAEQAEEERRNAEIEASRGEVAAAEAAVQDRIDQLLSSSPEDFVIRFVQTEGQ